MGYYWKDINFYVADIGDLASLGIPWFRTLNFSMSLAKGRIDFKDLLTGRAHKLSSATKTRDWHEPAASTTIPIKRMSLKAFRKDKNKGSLTSVFKIYLRELLEPSDLLLGCICRSCAQ